MIVTLVEIYNPDWPSWFEQLRIRLEGALNRIPHSIEHVGSTAVPGMTAKPIIDIDIICEIGGFPVIKDRLTTIGYVHEGDKGIPGREAFETAEISATMKLPSHHLYVCEKGNQGMIEHLAYRDFMRQHPEWREKLSVLKWSLCERYDNERLAYMDGKSDMVKEITRIALGER